MMELAIQASSAVVDTPPRPPLERPGQPVLVPEGKLYTMGQMAVKQARQRGSDPAAGAPRSPEAVAGAAQLACVLEASAEKPGNITPRHDFADTSYEDMLRSAIALGPEIGRAAERGVGATVLAAVLATRRVAPTNTNLGIALLLTPLARAALLGGPLRERVKEVLGALTLDDARAAYAAIRAAGAGGLDEPVEHDVRATPTVTLRDAMAAAADRDSVAAEYATGYAVTFELGLPALHRALDDGLGPRAATVELYLELLAAIPDTLVARKRGRRAAERVSAGAASVLAAGGVRTDAGHAALEAFDASLRRDGNALNPGTTADLVTAVLFVALLEGLL
jgi:triphosphoribosyl-dephospho-CoA synthase